MSFTDRDVPNQSGRVAVVTGANTGIGLEVARVLAAREARVLLACRNPDKAAAAIASVRETTPDSDIEFVPLDLGDLSSIRAAAEIIQREERLDLLVNNAGVMMPPLSYTVDGFEQQFGVNHLGPFGLTALLLPTLLATPGSRIVNTSSNAHKGASIDFDDLDAKKSYSATRRYMQSKLANLLHTYELDRRLSAQGASTLSVAAHPGASDTDLMRHSLALRLAMPIGRLFLNSAAQGAWPTLMAATAPGVEGGQYFGPRGPAELAGRAVLVQSTRRSREPELARRLWDVSVELTGMDPGL